MDYKNYTVNDFATDESFRKWVKQPEEADHKFWTQWIARHPDKKEVIEEAKRIVHLLDFEKNQPRQEAFEEVRTKIKTQIKTRKLFTEPAGNKTGRPAYHPQVWRKIAAVFVGLTIMGLLYFFFMGSPSPTYYATDFGEIQTITLPDGSVATLNGNSTLKIAEDWEAEREVWLNGEAFFEVKKIAEKSPDHQPPTGKKFRVHTQHLDVEVLGTTFNVNERRGITRVALNTGRVQLIQQTDEDTTTLPMQPGELVAYEAANKHFRKQMVNPELVSVWKENKFIFNGTSLQEIAYMLEDNYGFTVEIQDEALAQRKFTASLPSRDVDFLLDLIAELLDIRVTKDGNRITIENYP